MKSLGGFALFASAFGVTVAMLVQNVGEFTDPSVATSAASTTSSDIVQSRGPVVVGADPLGDTQIVVRMAPFTDPLAAQQLGEEYGLHMVGSSPSFGRYVFDLPTIDVAAGPTSDTALVSFPPLASGQQISSYLSENGLRVKTWMQRGNVDLDPARNRIALVELPQIKPQLLDGARGLWQARIPLHLDPRAISGWAQGYGLQVVNYDPNTGALVIKGPSIAPARSVVTYPTIRRIVHTPAPTTTTTRVLYVRFASNTTLAAAKAAIQQAGGQIATFDPATGLATVQVTSDRAAVMSTLLSAVPGVLCVNATGAACSTTPPGITPPALGLGAPTALSLAPGTQTLTWHRAAQATAYIVYRAASPTGPYAMVGRVEDSATPSFTDPSAPDGVLYYRVQSVQACLNTNQRACDVTSPTLDPEYATPAIAITIEAPAVTPSPTPVPSPSPAPAQDPATGGGSTP